MIALPYMERRARFFARQRAQERRTFHGQALRMRRRDALEGWMMLCCAHVAHVLIRNRFDSDSCLDVLARAANHYAALLACLCRLGDPQWDGSWDARSPYGVTGGNGGWRGIVIPIVARQEGRDVSLELGIGGFRPCRWWQRLFGLGWDRARFHVFVREAASEKEVATGKEAALQWLYALPWPVHLHLEDDAQDQSRD